MAEMAPSWSTTLGLRHVYILKSEGAQDELEFKKSSTWSTTLGPRHVYLPICGRKSQVTSSRHIVEHLLAKKNLMKLLYVCTCVFFDLWYFRVRVSLRMWQEIYRPLRSLPCTAQIHIPYVYIWINQHKEFVAIQSRARFNLNRHSNCITDTAC